MDNVIEVRNLSKSFTLSVEAQTLFKLLKRTVTAKAYRKTIWALKNINFNVKKGERIALIGDNGSGKTTLLRIIAGIYTQTEGAMKINGRISSFIHFETVFQRKLSVLDNIYLFGAIMGLKRYDIDKKLGSILDFSQLYDYIYTPLKELSTGMYQRLAFSIAKEADSKTLILDETIASSDAGFKKKCFGVFENYKKEAKTLILASHDMEMARQFCEKALLLDKGHQIAFGPVDEVVDIYLKKGTAPFSLHP